MENDTLHPFVRRDEILAILLSQYVAGNDKPTLLAIAVAFSVEKKFIKRLEDLPQIRNYQLEAKNGKNQND